MDSLVRFDLYMFDAYIILGMIHALAFRWEKIGFSPWIYHGYLFLIALIVAWCDATNRTAFAAFIFSLLADITITLPIAWYKAGGEDVLTVWGIVAGLLGLETLTWPIAALLSLGSISPTEFVHDAIEFMDDEDEL